MSPQKVVIVGAGIIGLAHAITACEAGYEVTVLERDGRALGASVRNFGTLWPIGCAFGSRREQALAGVRRWKNLARDAGFWIAPRGSLSLAYREEAWAVLNEFAREGAGFELIDAAEVTRRFPAANPDGLRGALYSAAEAVVQPACAIAALTEHAQRLGVTMRFGLPVVKAHDDSVEQTIAPRSIEWALLKDEALHFPEWETPTAKDAMMEDYCAREAAEWAAADLVVCGSEFVREGIIASGGDPARCVVVPYGIERHAGTAPRTPRRDGPLRVLTVGAVGLRKGAPHVLAAARQLGKRAEFRMVGAVQVLPEAERELRAHVQLTGVVPRSEVAAHYAWADVFLLPSLCEGSATSTYEAMFQGLPIICTPQTGSVVRDGIDGFLVPARNGGAIAEKLALLADQPALLAAMSESARQRSADFTLEKYGERLIAAFRGRGII